MNNYLGDGDTVDVVVADAVTGGTPFSVNGTTMVPVATVASGATAAVVTDGHIRLPKVSAAISSTIHKAAEAFDVGDEVFWDETNAKATRKAVGSRLGWATKAAASGAAYVDVLVQYPMLPSQIDVVAILDATLNSSIGTHNLPGGKIPAGFIVKGCTYEPVTTFTSATDAATIALGVETQDDDCLKTATAISSGTTWDAVSPATPVQASAAAVIKTTEERSITAKIAVETLTAGRMAVIVHCVRHGVVA